MIKMGNQITEFQHFFILNTNFQSKIIPRVTVKSHGTYIRIFIRNVFQGNQLFETYFMFIQNVLMLILDFLLISSLFFLSKFAVHSLCYQVNSKRGRILHSLVPLFNSFSRITMETASHKNSLWIINCLYSFVKNFSTNFSLCWYKTIPRYLLFM